MVWHPTKAAVQRLWGRRWVRRVAYTLVAGATVFNGVPWLATRPAVLRWAVGKLGAYVQEETGLPLTIGRVQFQPALGSLILHEVALGGDLLTIQRAELQADVWSLLKATHRIHLLRVEHPHLRLTEAGLAAFRLKPHPPRQGPLPQFWLELLSITSGEIVIPEPLRGLPPLHFQFDAKATGLGPNHVRVDVAGAQLAVKGPEGWERGRLDLKGEASEPKWTLQEAYLRLGESQVRLNGRFQAATPKSSNQVEARLGGVVDLAQATRWGGLKRPLADGRIDIVGTLQGSLEQPAWSFSAEGQNLQPGHGAFSPGGLEIKGHGGKNQAHLDQLRWHSPQGEVEVQSTWSGHGPAQAQLQGKNLDLELLGKALRLPEFRGVRGTAQAEFKNPGTREALRRLDRWEASIKVALTQNGLDAGGLEASVHRGRATLDRLKVNMEALTIEGTGWAEFGPRGLINMQGGGSVEVDARHVAEALSAWKLADLDMEGKTRAQAEVHWNRLTGIGLEGSLEVGAPRWHGARAEALQAKVEILGSELWVKDISIHKDQGRGSGDLWLTWAPTAPGQSQMDMCYTAFRLPVVEGLRAADLQDLEGKDLPLQGTASGWARLHGPFDHITLNGSVQVEAGEAYGVKIPAASSDFDMDLEARHLRLSEVRIAERPDLLGSRENPPEGALALSGQADMDFRRWTWWVDLGGRLDSQLLDLPGPRIQSQVQARLLGPITSPFGALDLPEGRIDLNRGRIFFRDRSVEGLQGSLNLDRGHLAGRLGIEGMSLPLLELQVHQKGLDLEGGLSLTIASESAHTESTARSLTEDLLEDLSLSATAQGRWKYGQDLAWSGSLDRLAAQFSAFELHQSRPSVLKGDARSATVDIALEGGGRTAAPASAAQVHLSGNLPFRESSPLALQVKGEADLDHLKAILDRVMEVDEYSLLSELRVQGTSRFDVLAHGTYAEPLLDGRVSLTKGHMRLRRYQGVEDLQAEVILKDRTLAIPEDKPLHGTLAGGELQANGAMTWRPGGLDAYALQASLANFQLRDVPDGLDLQGSLQASLEGTEDGGLLKGTLQADRLNYHTEVKLADLILRSALSESGGLGGLELDDPLERIRLDLDLELRAPWSFDTNLMKLEGRTEGSFQVLGTLGHPVPKGTLLFQPGGRVTNVFPAGDVVVNRGSLDFSELRPMDPRITLEGSLSSIPGYTVNLDIRGTLSNLAIIPSSTPSLRQDEIVAILINPGNVANVGTAGATSGATQGAITSGLAGASSGLLVSNLLFTPLQEQLRRTFGLDRVNVAVRTTSLGTSETEFTLGKSINLLGQRSALVGSHKKSGELSITSGQVEWRFGNFILQLGFSKAGSSGLEPSGEIRHSWSPK